MLTSRAVFKRTNVCLGKHIFRRTNVCSIEHLFHGKLLCKVFVPANLHYVNYTSRAGLHNNFTVMGEQMFVKFALCQILRILNFPARVNCRLCQVFTSPRAAAKQLAPGQLATEQLSSQQLGLSNLHQSSCDSY